MVPVGVLGSTGKVGGDATVPREGAVVIAEAAARVVTSSTDVLCLLATKTKTY